MFAIPRHWISLGALSAIVLLAFEPFTQAVLTLEDQSVTLEADQYVEMARRSNESNGSVPGIGGSFRLDAASWIGLGPARAVGFIEFPGPDNKTLTHSFTVPSSEVQEDMGMEAAVWNGFSPLITTQSLRPSFACASGNCSWTNFASIAICSKCHDISHHIAKTHRMNNIPPIAIPAASWMPEDGESLPDVSNQGAHANHRMGGHVANTKHAITKLNFSLSNYDGKPRCLSENDNCPDTYLSSRVTANPGQTITFTNLSTMIIAIQYLAADESWRENRTQWETTKVTAQGCALSFCVNEYETIISQGSLHENVVSSWMNKSRGSFSSDQENVEAFLKYNNHSLAMGRSLVELSDLQIRIPDEYHHATNLSEMAFNITHPTLVSLQNILDEGFREPGMASSISVIPRTLIYPALGLRSPPSFMIGLGKAKDIRTTIENVALSLTKWMRDRELETNPVVGSAETMVVIIRVRWYFLLVPAISFLVGMAFAILIIWETLRLGRPSFKDSILAALACAPDGDLRLNLQQKAAAGSLQALGRESKVVWEDNCEIGQLREKKVEHSEV
ncbi:hypothetical protein FSARC_509 [Fusarium sarcochroum]|uniref:Uncharacterized protein n=1 Tax=Fusarium sarcochroum TaxID=1208366 RepID=A0A8H4UAV8_9HYPO|nr:hypothetical protein FSARC_509 [Fusarium sarcochroum]